MNGQRDTASRVRYTRDFYLQEGIYKNWEELKNNAPSITNFSAAMDNAYGERGRITLKYPCSDSTGTENVCTVRECFGYYRSGGLFLSQGVPGYFYRTYLVGSLTHFIAFTGYGSPRIFLSPEAVAYAGTTADFSEYILEIETGEYFVFNYRNFSSFLLRRDPDLLSEMKKTRKKRKMIYFFLLRYNDRHPLYFPAAE